MEPITIGVACRNLDDRLWLPRVRKLLSKKPAPQWAALVRSVEEIAGTTPANPGERSNPVTLARHWLHQRPQARLAIACGDPVLPPLGPEARIGPHEPVLVQLSQFAAASARGSEYPSLLHEGPITAAADIDDQIRKSILRVSLRHLGCVKVIDDKVDLRRYFRLRYLVWSNLGYLRADKGASRSKLEVDYTDRTATPIGFFKHDGRLVGCARLVRPLGHEQPKFVNLVQDLVGPTKDPMLEAAFKYPDKIHHPFDLLDEFRGFRGYYRELVRSRISVAEVSRVIVHPEFGRQGIAEAMVDSLITLAQREKIKKLFLACRTEHAPLYARSGFAPVAGLVSDKFINIPVACLVMERDVAS